MPSSTPGRFPENWTSTVKSPEVGTVCSGRDSEEVAPKPATVGTPGALADMPGWGRPRVTLVKVPFRSPSIPWTAECATVPDGSSIR